MPKKNFEQLPLEQVVKKLAHFIRQAQPLAHRLAGEESFADQREKLRELTGGCPAGGSYIFRLQHDLGRLCGESAWRLASPDRAIRKREQQRLAGITGEASAVISGIAIRSE